MPPLTRLAIRALDRMGGPKIIVTAIPGGIQAIAREAGVSEGRVSQILRKNPLPRDWARLVAQLAGCTESEVYQQLGQQPPVSPYGPLFDQQGTPPSEPGEGA